jgi:hypothetical protein
VLATDKHILAECGGRAQGANPCSFRAEGYGILAVLRLVFYLRYFYVTRNTHLRFRLYCDSESLLKRIEASRSLRWVTPRRFLYSEVDVGMQILSAIRALGLVVQFEHVEGHQEKYPERPLPWEAQLNQRCDEIATDHLEAPTTTLPTVYFLPASKVSITVGKQTLTHHIPTKLRTFVELSGIRAHFMERHKWDSLVIFDLIDWSLFHTATLSTTFLRQLFVIKRVNSLLPYQRQQHQYNHSPSAHCPSNCACEDEDWVHFPRCVHPQRRQAWTAFVPVVSVVMERWQVDPSLRRILLNMIVPLTTLAPILLDHLADEYMILLTTQQFIGDDSLLFGFFSLEGTQLQDRYLATLGLPRSKHEAAKAMRSLALMFYDQCHVVWLLRNQHLHGADPTNTTSYIHSHLLAQINELYDAAPNMMVQHDRDLFSFPIEL